jgi:HlyD family secretion protein
LREGGWATGEKLDQRATAVQTAEARLASARQALAVAQADKAALDAQRRELEVRLARTEIKAPKGGIVSRRTAKLGWVGSMVGEPMFRIIAEGEIELEAEVADVTLPRLKVGQRVAVTPAGFGESLAGTIRLISPEVDKATRLGRMRIAIAAPTGQMLPVGAFGRGQVELGRRSGVTLPQSAITWGKENGRDIATVQVIADGRVATRPVTLGLAGNGRTEIASGLRAGEKVVARAGAFLRDGDRVLAVAEEKSR